MRYFGHLALWTICGVVCVGLASALSNGLLQGGISWIVYDPSDFISFFQPPAEAFATAARWGGLIGGISGGIALFVLALPRSFVRGWRRLTMAACSVSLASFVGVPVVGAGLFIGDHFVASIIPAYSPLSQWRFSWEWLGTLFLAPIAVPVVVGALVTSRSLERLEKRMLDSKINGSI